MADYQRGHYARAKQEFGQVVSKFSDSPIASSAEFWIGQANFIMKDYPAAIDAYHIVIAKYPNSPKCSVSYFKTGEAYELMHNRKLAVRNYLQVLRLFPRERLLVDLVKRKLLSMGLKIK